MYAAQEKNSTFHGTTSQSPSKKITIVFYVFSPTFVQITIC